VILTELTIKLAKWGPDEGKHVGKAVFSGEAGEVTLNLNQHHLDEIFRTCADSIVDTAKAAARHLTCTVIEHQRKLEGGTP
jgi:hypothetical protein